MAEIVIYATVNISIYGGAGEAEVRAGVRKGLSDLLTADDVLKKIREARATGGL